MYELPCFFPIVMYQNWKQSARAVPVFSLPGSGMSLCVLAAFLCSPYYVLELPSDMEWVLSPKEGWVVKRGEGAWVSRGGFSATFFCIIHCRMKFLRYRSCSSWGFIPVGGKELWWCSCVNPRDSRHPERDYNTHWLESGVKRRKRSTLTFGCPKKDV